MFQRKVNTTTTTGNDGISINIGGDTATSPMAAPSPSHGSTSKDASSRRCSSGTTPTSSGAAAIPGIVSTGSASSSGEYHNPTLSSLAHQQRHSKSQTARTTDDIGDCDFSKKKKKPTQFRNIFLPLYHHPYKSQSTRRRRGAVGRRTAGGSGWVRHLSSKRCFRVIPICLTLVGAFGMIWMSMRLVSLSSTWSSLPLSATSRRRPFVPPPLPPPSFDLVSSAAPICRPLKSREDVTVTLVTQLSEDRLWMMEHHCDRYVKYGHPMSISVYSNNTKEQVLEMLREMDCPVDPENDDESDEQDENEIVINEEDPRQRREQQEDRDSHAEEDFDVDQQDRRRLLREENPGLSTQTKPLLQVSVLDARTHGAWNDYPVNTLRNLALSQVDTSYIIYIDVDFWPSEDLYETVVESPDVQDALLDDPKRALVIPAFSLLRQCVEWKECPDENIPNMPRSLVDLVHGIKKRRVTVFDPTNKGGHGSTDYKGWFKQEIGSLQDIPCLQSHRYEPFLMIRYCRELPPFQEAFSGYGKNKVSWMEHVVASGYVFSQVGGAYLVHYPHLDSQSRQHWNEAPKELKVPMEAEDSQNPVKGRPAFFNLRRPEKTDRNLHLAEYKRGQVDRLYVEFRKWLLQSIPSQQRRLQLCEDHQNDDGKLWIDPELKEQEDGEDEGSAGAKDDPFGATE